MKLLIALAVLNLGLLVRASAIELVDARGVVRSRTNPRSPAFT